MWPSEDVPPRGLLRGPSETQPMRTIRLRRQFDSGNPDSHTHLFRLSALRGSPPTCLPRFVIEGRCRYSSHTRAFSTSSRIFAPTAVSLQHRQQPVLSPILTLRSTLPLLAPPRPSSPILTLWSPRVTGGSSGMPSQDAPRRRCRIASHQSPSSTPPTPILWTRCVPPHARSHSIDGGARGGAWAFPPAPLLATDPHE
jgi:hypothetical protein